MKAFWGVVTLVLVGCNGGTGTGGGDSETIDGAEVYDANCTACHGDDGQQGTEVNGTAAANLTVAVPALSDDELKSVITDGSGVMSAVSGVDDAELDPLVEFLREQFPE